MWHVTTRHGRFNAIKKTGLTRHAISKALHCPSFAKSILAPNVTTVGAAFLLLFLRFLAWGSWPSRTKHKAFSISILFSPRSITWWEKPTLTLGSRFDSSWWKNRMRYLLIWWQLCHQLWARQPSYFTLVFESHQKLFHRDRLIQAGQLSQVGSDFLAFQDDLGGQVKMTFQPRSTGIGHSWHSIRSVTPHPAPKTKEFSLVGENC